MSRHAIVAFAFAASLAGCTPMQWQKADATAAQLQADDEECRQSAWREASLRSWHYHSMPGPALAQDASGRAAMVWPSTPMVDPYGHQMMEESRLARSCMEAKGYTLAPLATQ
jgi:hypothetical protein